MIRIFQSIKTALFLLSIFSGATCIGQKERLPIFNNVGDLEIVAKLSIAPGNVTASKDGSVFATIHPLRPQHVQLIEITGKNTFKAFPDESYQSKATHKNDFAFDSPLGILIDRKNRLWVVDAGLNLGKTRIFAFDIVSRKEVMRFEIPEEIASRTSFVQDIAVDDVNEWVYLADFGNPGIISLDIHKRVFQKFRDTNTMQSEDIDIKIEDKIVFFKNNPARIGINPISISADNETLYYGAMNGTKWYKIPTKLIREGKSNTEIATQVKIEGNKPISDGVSTDAEGNHFFTNIQNGSIDVLGTNGKLQTLVKDPLIQWPDNVRFGEDSWLYISVNQLHKSPFFAGGKEEGEPPFYILKTWTGTKGIPGR